MINGKPLILLIRGRQNISKWSNNSYREAICCRKPPQFVVTSRDGTVTSSHCWSDQTRRPSLTPWWSQAHPKSQIQSLTQKYLQGIPQACHPPLSLPWWSQAHLRPQTQLLFLASLWMMLYARKHGYIRQISWGSHHCDLELGSIVTFDLAP